jgi:TPR repeat protein
MPDDVRHLHDGVTTPILAATKGDGSMEERSMMLGLVVGLAVVVTGVLSCTDKAKPAFDRCVQADTAGDLPAALAACADAVKADPNSGSGKLAAARAAVIEQKKRDALAAADQKARDGFHLWDGDADAVTKDQPGAQKVFTETCSQGSQLGCTGLAITYLDGVGGTGKDYKKALALLQPACDAKVPRACSALGNVHAFGEGLPKDENKAADLYKIACDGGEQRGCYQLALWYAVGKGGLPKDMPHAFALVKTACDTGFVDACYLVASAFRDGDGAAKSLSDALAYGTKACNGLHGKRNGDGCQLLAHLYNDGDGVPKDSKRAAELASIACDLGSGAGCTFYGFLLVHGSGIASDAKAAYRAFEKACAANDAEGCFNVAICQRHGLGTERDGYAADTVMKKACDLGDATACKEFRR